MHSKKIYLLFFHILRSIIRPVSVFRIDNNVIILTIFFTFVNGLLILVAVFRRDGFLNSDPIMGKFDGLK
jgi:hypothetical protein